MGMDQEQTPHKRRVRYKGKYPRKFEEKYKHYGTFETDDGLVLRHFSEQELNELLGDFDIVSAVKQKCREMNGGVNISVSIAAKLRQKNSAS